MGVKSSLKRVVRIVSQTLVACRIIPDRIIIKMDGGHLLADAFLSRRFDA